MQIARAQASHSAIMYLSAKAHVCLHNHCESEAEREIWGSNRHRAARSKITKCQPLYPINAEAKNDACQQTAQKVLIYLFRFE